VTGFAPEIYDREHVKILEVAGAYGLARGGSVGSLGDTRWWVAGTCNRRRRTAAGNAFMVQAGGGVDFRVNDRLSLRAEGDYVFNNFFKRAPERLPGRSPASSFHF